MLVWDREKKNLRLEEFDQEGATAFLDQGQPVIPVWLERISQGVTEKLRQK